MTSGFEDLDAEKRQLLQQRDALRARLTAIHNDYRKGLDADSEERASQLANAEVLDGIARAAAEELERIEARLEELG